MFEWCYSGDFSRLGLSAGREFQKCFRSLGRQMFANRKNTVFVGVTHVIHPLSRNAIAKQRLVRQIRIQLGFLCQLRVAASTYVGMTIS